ncbi:MAG: UPF0146 family protein [Methanocaldococcus sp.]
MNVEIISEFIKNFAEENNCKKIAEIGIGFNFDVARKLNNYFNLIVIDINEKSVKKARLLGLNAYKDDLFNPNINLYEDVDLMYSIRPPRDLQMYMFDLSKKVNANLIIRPLLNEMPIKELKLKNYKGEVFYIKEK